MERFPGIKGIGAEIGRLKRDQIHLEITLHAWLGSHGGPHSTGIKARSFERQERTPRPINYPAASIRLFNARSPWKTHRRRAIIRDTVPNYTARKRFQSRRAIPSPPHGGGQKGSDTKEPQNIATRMYRLPMRCRAMPRK